MQLFNIGDRVRVVGHIDDFDEGFFTLGAEGGVLGQDAYAVDVRFDKGIFKTSKDGSTNWWVAPSNLELVRVDPSVPKQRVTIQGSNVLMQVKASIDFNLAMTDVEAMSYAVEVLTAVAAISEDPDRKDRAMKALVALVKSK